MRCHPALRLSLLLVFLLLILSSSTCLAGVVYVKWDSPNDGPGNDWDHAYHSVQAGIGAALSGDEVWVAAGTYVEQIRLKSSVGLYGGFAGAETSRDQRDWNVNASILDGNQAGSTVAAYFGTTSATIIDGFTIRNGNGTILGTDGERYGGGILCNIATPIIRNNTITGNSANHGAGIYCSGFPPVITHNVITGNVATSTGGGIGCWSSAALLEGNTIAGNSAASGGGIACSGTPSPTIRGNEIAGNAASSQGAGIHCYRSSPVIQGNAITGNVPSSDSAIVGGGIYCVFLSSPTITGNMVADNSASSGGGIYFEKNCSPNITNNTIARNMATEHNGGGICCLSSARITNNTIRENTARRDGGGFYCATTSSVTVSGNAVIGNNTRQGDGGGICSDGSSPTIDNNAIIANRVRWYGRGGGIFCTGGSPVVVNNTLAGNSAETGAGIYCYESSTRIRNNMVIANDAEYGGGIMCSGYPYASITNNTIAGNSSRGSPFGPGGIACGASAPTITNNIIVFNSSGICGSSYTVLAHNCVYGNGAYDYYHVTPGQGDFSEDPKLACLARGDCHIQPDSPCLDAGDNSVIQPGWTDIDGQDRIQPTGGTVDIGADESDGTWWSEGPQTIVRVSPEGNDANDGSSWALARRTVQAAIDAASLKGGEVWVKAGVYDERIGLRPFVSAYGGFNGTETERAQRNWAANITILDGGGKGIVVTAFGGGTHAAIDGFTIRNGKEYRGAGIWCYCSDPVIVNNTIVENTNTSGPGGGIWCEYSSPMIANNNIMANTADMGGGICSTSYSEPSIVNNTIVGNSAGSGGGMYAVDSQVTMVNNIIAFNSSGVYESRCRLFTFQNNCVYGNTMYDFYGFTGDPTGANGNISVDPELASFAYGNVHIQPDSPCIDAGNGGVVDPAWLDTDAQDRIQGAHVDIGADESDGTAWQEGPYVTVRVSPDGNDANDGSSWVSAKRTVQAGIHAASAFGGDVWVRAGTYLESIGLRPHVHVFGGFSGLETDRTTRDWHENVTILEGMGDAVVTASAGAHGNSAIDGFTIQNGNLPAGSGVKCLYASPVIANNDIVGNATAIRCYDSSPTIVNNRISGNSSGGIYCNDSSPTVAFNLIDNNTSGYYGGGICSYSDAKPRRSPVITGNIITGNSAVHRGGAVYCGGSPTITGNVISDNVVSDGDGGGIACHAATISNNMITRNSSSDCGGGIYCQSSSPTITNNTIVGNSAPEGGGICSLSCSPTITNTIVAFNSSGMYDVGSGTPTLRHNCVYGNTAYDFVDLPDPTGTNGNISEDPLFLDPAYGDYHLTGLSPCIDAGDDSVVEPDWLDMDGEPRIQLLHVDIGADEYAPIPVQIDVLPGESANNIRLQPNRMITVAVLSDTGFDARNVDPLSVVFGPGLAAEVHGRGHWEDANGDGLIDLLLHFRCGETGIQPGDTSTNLYGRLTDGEIIAGSDTITAISK